MIVEGFPILYLVQAHHITIHDTVWPGHSTRTNLPAGINTGIDSGPHPIAQHGTKLASLGIHKAPLDVGPVIGAIMTMIGNDRSCSQRHMGSDDRIANVAEMFDIGMRINHAVFDFHSITNDTIVTN